MALTNFWSRTQPESAVASDSRSSNPADIAATAASRISRINPATRVAGREASWSSDWFTPQESLASESSVASAGSAGF